MNTIVSIIIPCYNSFKYMKKCLAGLENQTFKNFEVIFIDDCSTDDTKMQLETYKAGSTLNIQIIHNEINKGPGYSRNIGIQCAKGEWVTFADADDWFETNRLELMIEKANNADCILCNYSKVFSNKKKEIDDYLSRIPDIQQKADIVALSLMAFWVCMIKKEIALKIPVAELYNGEDYATMPLWLQESNSIICIKDSLYNYYMRAGSASRKPSEKAYVNFYESFEIIQKKSKSEYKESIEFLGVHHILYGGVLTALKAGINLHTIIDYISRFESNYPNWMKNKYIKYLPKYKRLFLALVRRKNMLLLKCMAIAHTILVK